MKKEAKAWVHKLLLDTVLPDAKVILDPVLRQASQATILARAAIEEVKELRRQMSALLALDVGFKENGKAIIMTRINGQDRVKFIDIPATMDPIAYKDLVERLKHDFGVDGPKWVDKPMGVDDVFIGGDLKPTRRGVRSR